jgi:hypothetical protein
VGRGPCGPAGFGAPDGLAKDRGFAEPPGLAARSGRSPFGVSDQCFFALPAGAAFFGVRRPPGFFGLALAQPGFFGWRSPFSSPVS